MLNVLATTSFIVFILCVFVFLVMVICDIDSEKPFYALITSGITVLILIICSTVKVYNHSNDNVVIEETTFITDDAVQDKTIPMEELKEHIKEYREYSVNGKPTTKIWVFENGEEYVWTVENTTEKASD